MRSIGVVAAALTAALSGAAADAQEFRYRGWIGARLPNDKDAGCAMALELRRDGGLVVYANAKRVFKIGIGSRAWTLEPGKEAYAAVTFNAGPPIVLKGAAISPTTVLFEPLDPDSREAGGGLEPLVESARTVQMTYAGHYLKSRLSGSSRALKMLWECAAAPPSEAAPVARAPRDEAPDDDRRGADFAFLRQGMDVAEAHGKLLEAGWQAEPAEGADAASPAVKALRERDLPVSTCAGEPPSCALDYADAFGNALKVTVVGEPDPKLRAWRLNPEEARKAEEDQPEADPEPDDAPR